VINEKVIQKLLSFKIPIYGNI